MKYFALAASLVGFSTLSLSAQIISTPNVFNDGVDTPAFVTMNSTYSSNFLPPNVDDLTTAQSVFGDYNRGGGSNTDLDDQLMTITGFSAPTGIDSLVFFDTGNDYEPGRNATQVTIYYSTSEIDSDNPSDYTAALNGGAAYTLGLGSNGRYENAATDGSGVFYDTLSLNIPGDAQSLLLDFGGENLAYALPDANDYYVGAGFSEIQAFAAAPEPSVYALMTAGLLALAGLGRLRRLA